MIILSFNEQFWTGKILCELKRTKENVTGMVQTPSFGHLDSSKLVSVLSRYQTDWLFWMIKLQTRVCSKCYTIALFSEEISSGEISKNIAG